MGSKARRIAGAVVLGLVTLVGTGCAAGGPGAAPATATPAQAVAEQSAAIELLGRDACTLLTAEQAPTFDLNLANGTAGVAGGLRTCSWTRPAGTAPLVLGLQPAIQLSDVRHGGVAIGGNGRFEDSEIGGFPALLTSSAAAASNQCAAFVDVGTGILTVFGADTCTDAQRILGLVLGNLRTA